MNKNISKNSYLKLLEDSIGVDKVIQIKKDMQPTFIGYINGPGELTVLNDNILSLNTTTIRPLNITPIDNISINNDTSENLNIHGLTKQWILARERLINNARVLNNGWTVNWRTQNLDQNERAYIYASNYNSETNTFLIDEAYAVFKHNENGLIFKTRELARQFIEQNQEDLQIYFSL